MYSDCKAAEAQNRRCLSEIGERWEIREMLHWASRQRALQVNCAANLNLLLTVPVIALSAVKQGGARMRWGTNHAPGEIVGAISRTTPASLPINIEETGILPMMEV